MTPGTYFLVGAAALAAAGHTLIPDHWLPYILTAKAKKMPRSRAMGMAVVGAIAHLFSTVLIGLVFALIGEGAAAWITRGLDTFIGLVVIGLGVYFIWRGWPREGQPRQRQDDPDHSHAHHHNHAGQTDDHPHAGHGHSHSHDLVRSDYALGALLGARPCAESIPIFLAASTRGVFTSLAAIAAWVAVTIVSMVGIVWLSLRGLETVRLEWLERNGEVLSGIIIVVVGVIALL
ncbi:MAG: hypothetical protein M1299_11195 [Firmicutes bacterium]|nr:hypothetical protein [Bacillota bacterium]MCL5040367.1 hypothetical protein [Bacillota bacterium]